MILPHILPTIAIPGRPIPALRMTQKSKWSNESIRYLSYKGDIGITAKSQGIKPTNEKVTVKVLVWLHGKTTPMGRDGDIDNYLKSALDGLNKIAWKDDRQVVGALVAKRPCEKESEQRMEIEISIVSDTKHEE